MLRLMMHLGSLDKVEPKIKGQLRPEWRKFPKKDELGKVEHPCPPNQPGGPLEFHGCSPFFRPISSRPVQTEVDLEPSPPELVWGASVNQSMKL
uniref:Uncharacterized protein n=1 Tax=Bursaphelenchus xylophilus TaxID=6326 RepID=A0A1I7SN05_BURXY